MDRTAVALEELAWARVVADHACSLGVIQRHPTKRIVSNHLGAVLADAALQAGVRYDSVVRVRVERIHATFPEAATLPGLLQLLKVCTAGEILSWTHHVKTTRFISLIQLLSLLDISTTSELQHWLSKDEARDALLTLHGVGPKTYDYLCCLVGIDSVAVDRHVRTFASEAGVYVREYARMRSVITKAADLLNVTRRDFDGWIWQTMSERAPQERQSTFEWRTTQ